MKVSIITVTFNSEKYLESCITSVMLQDYKDLEYIVIDGRSTDQTMDIVTRYGHVVSKWISEPDRGIYDAINKGIELSTGDIVGVLNSDDYFADINVVSRIVSSILENGTEIIFSDIDFVSADDLKRIIRNYSSKLFRSWMFRFGHQPAHPTFYTYRTNFIRYGLYRTDLKIAGDFELMLRFIFVHHLSYSYIDDTWVKMRTGGVSTSGVRSKLALNTEIRSSLTLHSIKTNYLLIYSKYLFKWWGFLTSWK